MSELIQKVWGTEEVLVNNEKYCAKILTIQPGGKSSLHFHKVKDETFIVRRGWCCLKHNGKYTVMYTGRIARILPGEIHGFSSGVHDQPCEILEISTPHDDADVVRLEPSEMIK